MAVLLPPHWLLPVCLAWLALPVQAQQRPAACAESSASSARTSAGRPLLGQGIAQYEVRDLAQAEHSLQAALSSGLPDAAERASAHKYLAFVYCTQRQWPQCEAAFEAAFAAHAGFALQTYETTGTPWGQAYSRALERWTQNCRQAQSPKAAITLGSFELNSRVITAITPLNSATSVPRLQAAQAPRADHNLRLRISPWAHVRINGKPTGVTPPLVWLKLPAGTHTVELLSPGFESFRQVIQLTEGQLLTLSHDFDAR